MRGNNGKDVDFALDGKGEEAHVPGISHYCICNVAHEVVL